MKHFFATVALLVAVAGAAGGVAFRGGGEPGIRDALGRRDALTWLRTDLHWSDAQFAAIRTLHESYSTVCEEHCRAIQEAASARDALKTAPKTDAQALQAAERRVQELRTVCETAIAAH